MKFYLQLLVAVLCCSTFLTSQEFGENIYPLLSEGNQLYSGVPIEKDCEYNYFTEIHANAQQDQQKKINDSINGDKLELVLSADCEPLVTVANCVNLVSGTFFQVDKDLSSDSIEPLELTRFYDSVNCTESFLGFGFGAQYPLWASDIIEGARHHYGMISERDGFLIPYQLRSKTDHSRHNPFKIDSRLMEKGYTNLNRSVTGGNANFVNWQAFFRSKKNLQGIPGLFN